jgi:hypothetical protein
MTPSIMTLECVFSVTLNVFMLSVVILIVLELIHLVMKLMSQKLIKAQFMNDKKNS